MNPIIIIMQVVGLVLVMENTNPRTAFGLALIMLAMYIDITIIFIQKKK